MAYALQLRPRLACGRGRIDRLADDLDQLGVSRPFIVTDPGVAAAGLVDRVRAALGSGRRAEVYVGVAPNPTFELAAEALQALRGYRADGVIAVGGGSSIDVAKIAALAAAQGGEPADFAGGAPRGPALPVVAIPTTTGTGSEVTDVAVLTDRTKRRKIGISGEAVVPRLALLDPELVCTQPRGMIAATGLDALTHAIEAYTSTTANPFADALAQGAITRIGAALPAFYARREDVVAAEGMLVASAMAGAAFSSALLGLVHAMSHPVSCWYDTPHGLANAILLPHVMRYNLIAASERYARIAVWLGAAGPHTPVREAAEAAVAAVERLAGDVGIPRRLGAVGVDERHLERMVDDAFQSRVIAVNPRTATPADVAALYREAIGP